MGASQGKKKVKLKTSSKGIIETTKLGEDRFGTYGGEELWCPIYSFDALDWLINEMQYAIAHAWDQVDLITGKEGSGKSVLGMHIARKLDPDFSLEQISFTQEQFKTRVQDAKPGDVVMMDEAAEAMFAYEWMMRGQRDLVKSFLRFRIKRLKVILILPHQMLLNKQLRERRVHWWFDVYAKAIDDRGYAQLRKGPLRDNPWKTDIFWEGQFTLKFPSYESIDARFWREYEKYKNEFLHSGLAKEGGGRHERPSETKRKIVESCNKLAKVGWGVSQIAKHYGYSERTVKEYLRGD